MNQAAAPPAARNASVRWWVRLWVVRVLIVVGTLWVGAHSIGWLAHAARLLGYGDKPAMTIPSPDGQYKASVFVDMGGGPGTYYCGTAVYVAASGVSDAAVKDDGDRVYSASCGGLREGHWEQNIRWPSSSELQIDSDPLNAVEGDIEGAAIKGYAARGKVRVTYVFQKNPGDNW